tara:strand:- start:6312 stop:6776 length:465 start_codon:yes stop_codon:yes gene_type:complete
MIKQEKLDLIAENLAESLGFEFIASEMISSLDNKMILRIYLDKEGGIALRDCGEFSKLYNKTLDVELETERKYILEVSSPGSNRLLVKIDHFKKYIGSVVKVKLKQGIEGRKNFKGTLLEVNDNIVKVDVDGEIYSLIYADIEKANLVADFLNI